MSYRQDKNQQIRKVYCNRWDVFEELKKGLKGYYIFIDTEQEYIVYANQGDQELYDKVKTIFYRLGIFKPYIINCEYDSSQYTTYIKKEYLNQSYGGKLI